MKSISEYLNIDNVHDCNINGIIVLEKKTINIIISFLNKEIENIFFTGSKYCRFDDFRLGNIILSFDVFDENDVDNIDDYLCYVLDIKKQELNKEFIIKLKESISNKELILVALESSYGTKGVIICKSLYRKE